MSESEQSPSNELAPDHTTTTPPAVGQTLPAEQTTHTPPAPEQTVPLQQQAQPAGQPQGESFRRRSVAVPVIAALAVGALVGGVSGAGVSLWATSLNTGAPVGSDASPTQITVNDADDATQVTAVAAAASPSVVTLEVTSDVGGGSGSGVVLDDDGHILTNAHVVTLGGQTDSPSITVTTNDGRLLDAEIVGTDPLYDLAVVKVDADDLTPAQFADSADLNVGDEAIAIGAPLGLAGTVTDGIISALNRSITVASSAVPDESAPDEEAPEGEESPFDFWQFDENGQPQAPTTSASSTISIAVIQTDASINPGNSGGALLDSDGRVIGINVAIASAGGTSGTGGNIGVGFAIPSNVAQRIADELIDSGTASHGLLGASVADVDESPTVTDSEVIGASIEQLTEGSAAGAAGLRVGDVITKVDDIPITGKTDLTAQIRALPAGATTTLTYVRDGRADTVEVTLGQLQ